MNCDEARKRWHARLDEEHNDPLLDEHLASCGACRSYGEQMGTIVEALDDLRRDTESIVSRPAMLASGELAGPLQPRRHMLVRSITALAAALAAVIGATLYFGINGSMPALDSDRQMRPHDDSPRLGISLHGDSAERLLAVARPTSDPDVQVYWLYPMVSNRDEDNGS